MSVPPIVDQREISAWVPAVETLNRVLPLFKPRCLAGIRRILLLDHDYHRDKKHTARARYVPVKGTSMADIEIYLARWCSDLPQEAKDSPRYWLFELAWTVAHELYHHEVRAKRNRRPPFEQEQAGADRWGEQAANHIYHRLEDHKAHLDEWARIREGFKRQKGLAV